jgi:hypothetical protein
MSYGTFSLSGHENKFKSPSTRLGVFAGGEDSSLVLLGADSAPAGRTRFSHPASH